MKLSGFSGESNFTVFATDYDSYAIISNCRKGVNAENGAEEFTQHTTLWSRSRMLEENFVVKVHFHLILIISNFSVRKFVLFNFSIYFSFHVISSMTALD